MALAAACLCCGLSRWPLVLRFGSAKEGRFGGRTDDNTPLFFGGAEKARKQRLILNGAFLFAYFPTPYRTLECSTVFHR
jgi:hypothetical protein